MGLLLQHRQELWQEEGEEERSTNDHRTGRLGCATSGRLPETAHLGKNAILLTALLVGFMPLPPSFVSSLFNASAHPRILCMIILLALWFHRFECFAINVIILLALWFHRLLRMLCQKPIDMFSMFFARGSPPKPSIMPHFRAEGRLLLSD